MQRRVTSDAPLHRCADVGAAIDRFTGMVDRDDVLRAVDDCAAGLVPWLAGPLPERRWLGRGERRPGLARPQFAALGLEVDHWRLPLAELSARADFPGVEVDRRGLGPGRPPRRLRGWSRR